MIGWHEDRNNVDGLRANEARLGMRFALVRHYHQWALPGRLLDGLVAEGRLVVSSHKAPDPARGGWAAVASGAEDRMIVALADKYRSYGREIVFVFHHEPHDEAADVKGGTYGKAADFVAAWRRIHGIFVKRGAHHSVGGNVLFGYSAVDTWALRRAPGGSPGSGDPLYPGDDVVDVLAHDGYDWGSCWRKPSRPFAAIWRPLVALAAAHQKPLVAGEFGAAPGLRNQWFRDAARWLRDDSLARRWMWGFAYFHTYMDRCHWDFLNQGDDGRSGWDDGFARDPYFTDTPFSLRQRPTARPPAERALTSS